jgi:hypothetical protein
VHNVDVSTTRFNCQKWAYSPSGRQAVETDEWEQCSQIAQLETEILKNRYEASAGFTMPLVEFQFTSVHL